MHSTSQQEHPLIYFGSSVLISLLVVGLFSDSTSPFFYTRTLDSQVFQYLGFAMTEGKLPYTCLFDHKGMFLYFLNALGYYISSDWGVHLLQIVNMLLVLVVWYRILGNSMRPIYRHLSILPIVFCLCIHYDCGNMSEEWSLLFISFPLMLYFTMLREGRQHFRSMELFGIGICIGLLAVIRLNNVAPVIGLLLYCLFIALRRREYIYIGRSICLLFVGLSIPLVVVFGYMAIAGGGQGISDMIYGTLIFNLEYARIQGAAQFTIGKFLYLFDVLIPLLVVIPFLRRKADHIMPLLIGFVLSSAVLGKSFYDHYLLIYLPIAVAALACIEHNRYRLAVIACLTAYYGVNMYNHYSEGYFDTRLRQSDVTAFQKIIAPIPEHERGEIWNMASGYVLDMLKSYQVVQQNRMILPFQLSISPSLSAMESNFIQNVKPKYVLMWLSYPNPWMINVLNYSTSDHSHEYEKDRQFVMDNYIKLSSAQFENGAELVCYKRKGIQ